MNEAKLLKLIENNARLSVVDLSTLLDEKEDDVAFTLKKLEKDKIIGGYHTVINWDKTNNDKVNAIIMVGANPKRKKGYDEVAERIVQYNEVDSLFLMSGTKEFLVMVSGKTMQEIASFVGNKLACIDDVKSTETHFVLKRYKINGIVFSDEADIQERMMVKL